MTCKHGHKTFATLTMYVWRQWYGLIRWSNVFFLINVSFFSSWYFVILLLYIQVCAHKIHDQEQEENSFGGSSPSHHANLTTESHEEALESLWQSDKNVGGTPQAQSAGMQPRGQMRDVSERRPEWLHTVTHHMDALLPVWFCCVCVLGLSLCARRQWSKPSWYPATPVHDRSCDKSLCAAGCEEIWWRFHWKIKNKGGLTWPWWLNEFISTLYVLLNHLLC